MKAKIKESDLSAMHELVFESIKDQLESDPSPKTIELAIRFLRDNNYCVDYSEDSEVMPKVTQIPRLSDDVLRLA